MRTIMVVDKEQSLQATIAQYISKEDIKVMAAATNREAVTQLEDTKENEVALILVDRQIPGTTIRALYPVKPGEKTQDPKEAVLFKPFTKEQLLSFLQTQL